MCYSAGMRSKGLVALGVIALLGCSSGNRTFDDGDPMNGSDSGGMAGEDGAATNDDAVVIRSLDNCSVTIIDVIDGALHLVEGGVEADTLIR